MNSARIERLVLLSILLVIFTLVGCTRAHYRRQADREGYCLIESHATDPRWQLDDYSIYPSPASRMFDPANPDCEPMPPDDPASHRYMHCVDCKKGWPCWRCYGNTPFVENPYWRSCLPLDKDGQLVLDRQAAVQVALVNSRDYQRALEDLYLSALVVSAERFQFDLQFFATNAVGFSVARDSSQLGNEAGLGATKLLATGGQFAAGLANSVVWEFSGRNTTTSTTLLNFSLLQPLLQGAGRAVILEALTESERALLANARQMARFRQGFYLETVTGRDSGPGPSSTRLSIGGLAPGGPANVGGFFGLLQSQVQIRNQRSNVSGLQTSLEQLQAFYDAGRVGRVQVDQARQSVYNAQSNLLSIETTYENNLDDYKISLGLPPDLRVRIADSLLERFDLITPALTATQDAVIELSQLVGDETLALPDDYLKRISSLQNDVLVQVEQVRHDLATLDEALPERRNALKQLASREEVQTGQVERGVVDVEVLDRRAVRAVTEFGTLEAKIRKALDQLREFLQHPPEPSQVAPKPPAPPAETTPSAPPSPVEPLAHQRDPSGADVNLPPGLQPTLPEQRPPSAPPSPRELLSDLLTTLAGHMRALSLIQAAARLDAVTLVPVDLPPERAFQIACENRLDWMNARAALVDQWRQIEITANALRGVLNLTVDGQVSTVGGVNPVSPRTTDGQLNVGVQFEAPLTRLIERNNYRAALIDYQRTRRDYYAYVDLVNRGLRRTLRVMRLNQLDFEVSRTAVFNAISQVESAQVALEQPPKPSAAGQTGQASQQLSPTTARDITNALSGLLSAQNGFLGIWVGYEAQRMTLDFDLGTMQLDAHGMWIDPGPIQSQAGLPQPETIPPGPVGELFPAPPAPMPDEQTPLEQVPAEKTPAEKVPAKNPPAEQVPPDLKPAA